MLALLDNTVLLAKDVKTTTAETEKDKMYAPPAPPPADWGPWLMQQLDPKMYEILCSNRVPYTILKGLADDEWGDIALLLTRWPRTEDMYDDVKDTLGLADYSAKNKEKIRARMAASLEDLKYYKDKKREEQTRPMGRQMVDTNDRRAIEEAFNNITGEAPRLEHQGSPNMLGKLMTAAAEGRICDLPVKELVPYYPAPWIRTEEVWELGPDGRMELTEKKTRPPPTTASHWKDMMRMWYTTLMMALAANTHQPHIHVDKEWWRKLRRFYEDFLFGEAVLQRPNPPPLHQLMAAERKAWQRIASLMWTERRTLKEALDEVWGNHLWWQSLLDAKHPQEDYKGFSKGSPKGGASKGSPKGGGPRGPSQYAAPTRVRQQDTARQPKGGGRNSKGKGKGARNDLAARQSQQRGGGRHLQPRTNDGANNQDGQSQSGPRIPVRDWPALPDGKQRCRDFHVRGDCPRGANCPHSHKCPGCGRGSHSLAHCRNI